MSTTIFVNHTPNTHKVYHGSGDNGKVGYYIMFLDKDGNSRNAKGGKIYKHRQNANRDCEKLNHPIKHAIKKTGQCEAYHDGYTATVTDYTEEREGYLLSVQVGQMPPHYSQRFNSVEEVEQEMRDRSAFPVTVIWSPIKPEEN